jgi:hypothetical protein
MAVFLEKTGHCCMQTFNLSPHLLLFMRPNTAAANALDAHDTVNA